MEKKLPNITQRSYAISMARQDIGRFIYRFLGALLCGFFIFPVLAEEVSAFSKKHTSSVPTLVSRTLVSTDMEKRRDPFKPIKRSRFLSPLPNKPSPSPRKVVPLSTRKNPHWKLLGIIEGQFGRQAVIRISPQERVFVRSGLEVGRSGWIIKAISKREVLLEYSSPSTLSKGHSNPKFFSLSFSNFEQSS